jgi:hypothetical protein
VDETAVAAQERDEVREQIGKRLTLNLLIQGAAAHSFLTAHHLVKDELEEIRPGLTHLYDRLAISGHLGYWIGEIAMVHGPADRFWRRAGEPWHPFHWHRVLAEHGGDLARASKSYLVTRGWQKRVIGVPVLHYVQQIGLVIRAAWAERKFREQLARLAKRATTRIWGIDEDRLVAELTTEVAFGKLRTPKTLLGRVLQGCACGWGGVEQRDGRFQVVAKSWFLPLVTHELTKGVAELVCLHGLNTLDDATYEHVMREADQIEFEHWMLQAGAEAWRRLLAALPHDRLLPEMLMHIARLEPEPLEWLMLAVIEGRATARAMLKRLGE